VAPNLARNRILCGTALPQGLPLGSQHTPAAALAIISVFESNDFKSMHLCNSIRPGLTLTFR